MSGTSLDGLDIALCTINGSGKETRVNLERFVTKEYSEYHRSHLKKIISQENVSMSELCWQHTWLAAYHADLILEALADWNIEPEQIDCIASHGQTLYHLPARDQKEFPQTFNSTFQIVDGDQIAVRTGIMTISDFRQKHTASGGEGAPMAGLVDPLLFGDEHESRILLNIGGIANFTYLPAHSSSDEISFTTDTGPGNTLIDKFAYTYFQKPFDEDGKIAESGNINKPLLEALLKDKWFDSVRTKSTGPEYFSTDWIHECAEVAGIVLKKIRPDDLLATITELTAISIAENVKNSVKNVHECVIFTSGGGAHNSFLMSRLKKHLKETEFRDFSAMGFDPDAKEALIFAVLANEAVTGDGFEVQNEEGVTRTVNFGKISFAE